MHLSTAKLMVQAMVAAWKALQEIQPDWNWATATEIPEAEYLGATDGDSGAAGLGPPPSARHCYHPWLMRGSRTGWLVQKASSK